MIVKVTEIRTATMKVPAVIVRDGLASVDDWVKETDLSGPDYECNVSFTVVDARPRPPVPDGKNVEAAKKIDDALKAAGFDRDWYEGGPPEEPTFAEALDRGVRWYVHSEKSLYMMVSRRGTFHLKNDVGRTTHRGAGVGQLVQTLRKEVGR